MGRYWCGFYLSAFSTSNYSAFPFPSVNLMEREEQVNLKSLRKNFCESERSERMTHNTPRNILTQKGASAEHSPPPTEPPRWTPEREGLDSKGMPLKLSSWKLCLFLLFQSHCSTLTLIIQRNYFCTYSPNKSMPAEQVTSKPQILN